MTLTLGVICVGSTPLPKVRLDAGGSTFVTDSGRRFIPFGVNYFRPGTGWAPQVWKQFDEEATRRDFDRMRLMGVNCVRVFLSYGSFMQQPDRLEPEGLRKLDRFLELAEAAGLYVHPTGPDHWEGLPEWARGDRIADEPVLAALEYFWRTLAARYRGRAVLFGYDLLNEPAVGWDTPALRPLWNQWLKQRYTSAAAVTEVWGRPAPGEPWGSWSCPPKADAPGDRRLLDFQHFRESVADSWTRRQVQAIKAEDPDALVTVGLIQWSVPAVLGGASQYSGFRPQRQGQFVDFLSVHFYPLAQGAYRYEGPEATARNLAYLESVVREVAIAGKPVVVGEFGWYGGGQPRHVGGATQPATEEDQAKWCEHAIRVTAGLATGWLNWGFYDHPEARDVTEFTGLLKVDGTPKAWGRRFHDLSRQLENIPAPPSADGPVLNWDACLTSAEARREFAGQYLEVWQVQRSPQGL